MVEIRGLSKGFGAGTARVEVLKNLDLQVPEGQLLAVVGPSGVGKSTLLHLIGLPFALLFHALTHSASLSLSDISIVVVVVDQEYIR